MHQEYHAGSNNPLPYWEIFAEQEDIRIFVWFYNPFLCGLCPRLLSPLLKETYFLSNYEFQHINETYQSIRKGVQKALKPCLFPL